MAGAAAFFVFDVDFFAVFFAVDFVTFFVAAAFFAVLFAATAFFAAGFALVFFAASFALVFFDDAFFVVVFDAVVFFVVFAAGFFAASFALVFFDGAFFVVFAIFFAAVFFAGDFAALVFAVFCEIGFFVTAADAFVETVRFFDKTDLFAADASDAVFGCGSAPRFSRSAAIRFAFARFLRTGIRRDAADIAGAPRDPAAIFRRAATRVTRKRQPIDARFCPIIPTSTCISNLVPQRQQCTAKRYPASER